MYMITHCTVFGRHIYMVGGNAEAARRAAVDVNKLRIIVFFTLLGIAACGGIVAALWLAAVNIASGSGDVRLDSIAAAVIVDSVSRVQRQRSGVWSPQGGEKYDNSYPA
jgi:D-xylose transport system permease protein